MKTVLKRTLLTVLGVPGFLSIIYFFPHYHYLPFIIVILGFCLFAVYEMRNILQTTFRFGGLIPPWIAVAIPISTYIEITFLPGSPLTGIMLIVLISLIFTIEAIHGYEDDFNGSFVRVLTTTLYTFYPAVFVVFLVRLTILPSSSHLLVLLFLTIFTNDVFAYLFGMLFGGTTRNIFKVSPNKSLVGLLAGLACSVAVSSLYVRLFTNLYELASPLLFVIIFLITAVTANAGDLIESSFKRCARMKDSGSVIPGRGGVLDSIDSIVLSAPFFYYLCVILLRP